MGAQAITFKFEGDMKEFTNFFNRARMNTTLEKNMKRATLKNALFLVKRIKDELRNGNFDENKPLTLALSKGTKPLIKEKNLMDAINHRLLSSFAAEIGFIGSKNSTGGVASAPIDIKKVVELMHQNYTITVTPKMIQAIMSALNSQRTKRGNLTSSARSAIKAIEATKASGGGKRAFRVKARPFFNKALEGTDVNAMLQMNWREALEKTFLEQGAKDGDHKDK